MTWQDISKNPNSIEVINKRKKAIKLARKKAVSDRLSYIKHLAVGKEVLDIGVVDHEFDQSHSPSWLHGNLKTVARRILGLDILPEAVLALQKEGYDVRVHDITGPALSDKFDLIVAGEVIEHLGNVGALFTSAKAMLKPGGRMVLTTPNPYYIARVRDNLFYGFGWDSVDHVTFLFPFGIAELCERAGLTLGAWRGLKAKKPPTLKGRIIMSILHLLPLSEESLCDAIIYECVAK